LVSDSKEKNPAKLSQSSKIGINPFLQ
jgi:hypothetical protein